MAGAPAVAVAPTADCVVAATAAATAAPAAAPAAAPTIFAVIPSYRDAECGATLEDLFAAAAWPASLFVGLCLQLAEGNENAGEAGAEADTVPAILAPGSAWPWRSHVRTVSLPAAEAAGPVWARHLAASLWRGEALVLWLDSHMRFARGWDTVLCAQLAQAEEAEAASHAPAAAAAAAPPRVILTTYPPDYTTAEHGWSPGCSPCALTVLMAPRGSEAAPPSSALELQAEPRGGAAALGALASQLLLLSPASAAPPPPLPHGPEGFLRFVGRVVPAAAAAQRGRAPRDPALRGLFFGEESALLARAWTHGWAVWAPGATVVWHRWSRAGRPSFREGGDAGGRAAWARAEAQWAAARVRALLSGQPAPPPAGWSVQSPPSVAAEAAAASEPRLDSSSRGVSDGCDAIVGGWGWGPYGLGTERTLSGLEQWLGVPLLVSATETHVARPDD